jgi:hypothetical protein
VAEKKINFSSTEKEKERIPSNHLIKQFLGYARELERIV